MTTSYLSGVVFPAIKHGKRVRMPLGDLNASHSWTFVRDVATRSIIEVTADVSAIAGVQPPKASVLPQPVLSAAGLFVPFIRELRETRHQFETPFVIDSGKAERTFGLYPTPWEVALKQTLVATA